MFSCPLSSSPGGRNLRANSIYDGRNSCLGHIMTGADGRTLPGPRHLPFPAGRQTR